MNNEEKNNVPEETNESTPSMVSERKPGGLYRNVKMSVKTANILVIVGAIALLATMFFLANHNGFTITFDSNGGTYVESCKVMHSEKVPAPVPPTREGYIFTGWYTDRNCTVEWDMQNGEVTGSMTLYAGWAESG